MAEKIALPDISDKQKNYPSAANVTPQQQQQVQQGVSEKQAFYPSTEMAPAMIPVQSPVEPVQTEEEASYAQRLNAGGLTGKTADGYKAGSFYTDFFNKNNPYQKRVEDAEEQMERMRRNKLFATIGSGFDAFHQAYANMRGVKPMESPKAADKYNAQYNALKKYRDDNQLAYTNAYMQAMRNDAADKLNADMMKFREKQAEETKRHNDAMESIYADRITAGQQKADKDRASREQIASDNRNAANQRAAERNATSRDVAETSATSRKEAANIRYQNGGGRGTGGNVNKTETTTTSNRRGQTVKTVTKVTTPNSPVNGSGGSSSSGSKRALPKGSSSSSSGNSKKPLPKS